MNTPYGPQRRLGSCIIDIGFGPREILTTANPTDRPLWAVSCCHGKIWAEADDFPDACEVCCLADDRRGWTLSELEANEPWWVHHDAPPEIGEKVSHRGDRPGFYWYDGSRWQHHTETDEAVTARRDRRHARRLGHRPVKL